MAVKLSKPCLRLLGEIDQLTAHMIADAPRDPALVAAYELLAPAVVERMRQSAAALPDCEAAVVALFDACMSDYHASSNLLAGLMQIEAAPPCLDDGQALAETLRVLGLVYAYRLYVDHCDREHKEDIDGPTD